MLAETGSAPGASKGVVQNRAIFAEVPGDYIATIELFDDTTKSTTKTDIKFSVAPNQTARTHQDQN